METTNKGILKVSGRIINSLAVTFFYDDSSTMNITVCENDIVTVRYVDITAMEEITGKIVGISTTDSYDICRFEKNTILKIDCSSEYKSDIRSIAIHDIRDIKFVNIEEDTIEPPVEDEVDPGFSVDHE